MKFLVYTLAAIGALTVLCLTIVFVDNMLLTDPLAVGEEELGSPEGMAAISALYKKLEEQPHHSELKVVQQHWPKYPKIREIPASWIPDRLSKFNKTHLIYGNLYAYYDEDDGLIGIEFHHSRWGYFASRDATRCPSMYSSLRRVADYPLHVTVRQMAD